jgi:type IV pilus assembly protein PilW
LKAQYGVDDSPVGGDGIIDKWVPATGTWLNPSGGQIAQIQAIRVALVARSTLRERDIVTPGASIKLWPNATGAGVVPTGPTYTLPTVPAGEAGHYRYKVYTTIVPMRNLIWAH